MSFFYGFSNSIDSGSMTQVYFRLHPVEMQLPHTWVTRLEAWVMGLKIENVGPMWTNVVGIVPALSDRA
jgi:hypothetical protein